MLRNLTSIALALAIIAALTGSACLACWTPIQKAAGGCCNQKTSCHKSPKVPASHAHDACSAAKIPDLASVEKPSDAAFQIVISHNDTASLTAPAVTVFEASTESRATHYPPELYLLNSVLRV